ncbi:MAG: DUF3810 family protein [Fibrobacteria bacterium]|nr:DUF3810 family protein [Fibrobacteria bacterium]
MSLIKGTIVDVIPFCLTEIVLWIGLLSCVLLLLKHLPIFKKDSQRVHPTKTSLFRINTILLIVCGPVLLFVLISGQGAIPFGPQPTLNRKSLNKNWAPDSLSEKQFEQYVRWFEQKLHQEFNETDYLNLSEDLVLKNCNHTLDSLLVAYGLPKGRTLKRIKPLFGLTRLLGLSYGGPAFHDPLLSEVAMVRKSDLPTPNYWRLHAICHETAHAKGFTREMDTEILTQLALLTNQDKRLHLLGYILFLQKSGKSFSWPEFLEKERTQKALERRDTKKRQPFVRLLTHINKKLSIQNSGEKYGTRKKHDKWKSDHPFFTSVIKKLPCQPDSIFSASIEEQKEMP